MLSVLLIRNRPEMLIQTSPYISPLILPSGTKKMLFVCNYVWLHYRNFMSSLHSVSQSKMKQSIYNSDAIITISDYIKHETETYFEKANVHSIKLASDPGLFSTVDKKGNSIHWHEIQYQKPYILSVCTLEPRKDITVLIKAYAAMKCRDSYNLVLVGLNSWKNEPLYKTIQDHGIDKNIIFTGHVPDMDLKGLYAGALLFVFPSRY